MQTTGDRKTRSNRLKIPKSIKEHDANRLKVDEPSDEGYSSGNAPPTHNSKSNPTPSRPSGDQVKSSRKTRDKSPAQVDTDPSVRPKPLQRSESRTFVYIYDEDSKTSKPVAAPDNLNVEIPVLLQYELTEEAIAKCQQKPESETDGNNNGETSEHKFCSPTQRLLRSREKDEQKNKGMHVVKWLIDLDK